MSLAWFITGYNIDYPNPTGFPKWRRMEPFRDLVPQIEKWVGAECLGNMMVVKMKAPDDVLAKVAALPGVIRLPKNLLLSSLSDLTSQQRTTIQNKLTSMGYTLAEIRADLGNDIRNKTLGDVLRFACKRRLTPHLVDGVLVVDGAERPAKNIDLIDKDIAD